MPKRWTASASSAWVQSPLLAIKFAAKPTHPPKTESYIFMKINQSFSAFVLATALIAAPAAGFSQPTPPTQDSGAKQDMKNAGTDTKNATKSAVNGTKQGTKKAYHKTKRGTKKAYHKTKSTTTGAVDGAKQGAKQPQ